jgi:hypothetical protein
LPASEGNPDAARAAALADWLREQHIPRRFRVALLRDLRLAAHDGAGEESRLRGLDREAFVGQLHTPDGGAVARVAGIGDKALAALREAIPAPTPPQQDEPGTGSAPALLSGAAETASAPDDALAAITAAADGLLVPSESDYPFEPFRAEGSERLTPASLLAQLGLPPDTPVTTDSLEAFFAQLTRVADWMDEDQRAQAARFAELRDLIAARLRNVVSYRAGRTKIAVVIAGQDAAGATVGLRTTLIET